MALDRLENLLATIEGWVDVVTTDATSRLPDADRIGETARRRRAVGGPAEQALGALVGLQLRPRRLREAAAMWRAVTDAVGIACPRRAVGLPRPDAHGRRTSTTRPPSSRGCRRVRAARSPCRTRWTTRSPGCSPARTTRRGPRGGADGPEGDAPDRDAARAAPRKGRAEWDAGGRRRRPEREPTAPRIPDRSSRHVAVRENVARSRSPLRGDASEEGRHSPKLGAHRRLLPRRRRGASRRGGCCGQPASTASRARLGP